MSRHRDPAILSTIAASATVAAKAARKISITDGFWSQPDHEVSRLMITAAGAARYLGLGPLPRAKISTTLIGPPHQGHGRSSLKGSVASAGGVSCVAGAAAGICAAFLLSVQIKKPPVTGGPFPRQALNSAPCQRFLRFRPRELQMEAIM